MDYFILLGFYVAVELFQTHLFFPMKQTREWDLIVEIQGNSLNYKISCKGTFCNREIIHINFLKWNGTIWKNMLWSVCDTLQ